MKVKPVPFAPELRGVMFNAADLAGKPVPEQEWHVRDMIPAGQVTLFSGDGGTGKSLIALQLAVATATGGRWLGQEVLSGPVLFLTAEDDKAELHRRLNRIAGAERIDLAELDNLTPWTLAGCDALLAITDLDPTVKGGLTETPLFLQLEGWLARHPAALVVFDTLADLFGGNENARLEARQFVRMLAGLAQRQGCTVLLLAHPSVSSLNDGRGASGSTAWNNSVRSQLTLERPKAESEEPDADARILRVRKSNYGPANREISIRWRDGVFVPDERDGGMLDRMSRDVKADRVFLKLVHEFTAEGQVVRDTTGRGFAPHLFATSGRGEGCRKVELEAAMQRQLAAGRLRIETEGPPSRRTRRIVEVLA